MPNIIQYEEIVGTKEYIILVEDEIVTANLIDEHLITGYEFYRSYRIDGDLTGLPVGETLSPDR